MALKDVADRARLAVRALRHRNYRLHIIGHLTSLNGMWMFRTALLWLVYQLTNSAWKLGLIEGCSFIPSLLLGVFVGSLVDRYDRRRLLIVVNALFLAVVSLLTLVVYQGTPAYNLLLVFAIAMGLLGAFEMPARQTFQRELVGSEDLQNAIALNSLCFNTARFTGPALGGGIILLWGEPACFLIRAISLVVPLVCLMRMSFPSAQAGRHAHSSVGLGIQEGLKYLFQTPHLLALLALISTVSLLGNPLSTLLPVIARKQFAGEVSHYSWLLSAMGLGAMGGAAFLAQKRTMRRLGGIIAGATMVYGFGIGALAVTRDFRLGLIISALIGMAMVTTNSGCMTLFQGLSPDHLSGRLLAIYMGMFTGLLPFGNFLIGGATERFGTIYALVTLGVALMLTGLVFMIVLPRLHVPMRKALIQHGHVF